MRKIVSWGVLASLLLVTVAAMAQSRDEVAVRSVIDRLIKSFNSVEPNTANRFLADLAPAAGPFYPPFSQKEASASEVRASLNQFRARLASRSLRATSPVSVRIDRRMAWVNFSWNAQMTFQDATRHTMDGRATIVLSKDGRNWKIVHYHSSIPGSMPVSQSATESAKKEILQVERAAWEAIEGSQPDSLQGYFAEDVSVFGENQAYRTRGRTEALRAMRTMLEQADLRSWQILDPQVQLAGDTAVLTYYYTESGFAGGKEFKRSGKASVVFIKEDGTWRAIHEHRSANQ